MSQHRASITYLRCDATDPDARTACPALHLPELVAPPVWPAGTELPADLINATATRLSATQAGWLYVDGLTGRSAQYCPPCARQKFGALALPHPTVDLPAELPDMLRLWRGYQARQPRPATGQPQARTDTVWVRREITAALVAALGPEPPEHLARYAGAELGGIILTPRSYLIRLAVRAARALDIPTS